MKIEPGMAAVVTGGASGLGKAIHAVERRSLGDIVERRGLYVDNPGQGRLVVIEQAGSAGFAKMALAVFGRSIDRGRAALHFQRILGKRHPRYHQRTGAPAAILAVASTAA